MAAQVLVSASTATLVDGVAFALRDLGEHRFKDLAAAERVFQLGSDEFPPLKTLFQTNLPVPATPFLGRDRELGEVGELLARTRLLTLTGPGRRRQDPARAAGGGRRRGRVPAGRLVGAARRCRRPRIRPRRGEPVARSAGRARHDHRRSAAPPRAGQLRAPDRRGARALRAARRLPEPRPARDEPRAAPDRG